DHSIRHLTNRLGERPSLLRLDRHSRMGYPGVVRPSESPSFPLARVGPTTPTRARRLADASVDPTEARHANLKGIVLCSGDSLSSSAKWRPAEPEESGSARPREPAIAGGTADEIVSTPTNLGAFGVRAGVLFGGGSASSGEGP